MRGSGFRAAAQSVIENLAMPSSAITKVQIPGLLILLVWGVMGWSAAALGLPDGVQISVAFLGPVLAGYIVGRLSPNNPGKSALITGTVFVVLVFLLNLIINQGKGLLFIGGLLWLPFLTAAGGALSSVVGKSQ